MLASNLLRAIISFGVLASSAMAVANPAAVLETREDPGISIQDACNYYYGNGATAITVASGCYDWRCAVDGNQPGLNLNAWCQYLRPNLEAYASCSGGRYNWKCYWY